MRKRRKGRIYVKDKTNGRLYGDFRDLNNRCEALMQDGRATTDWDVAGILVAKRVKELEELKRGMGIVGRGREETLEYYALHHLEKKKASKGEQQQLDRAVEFFGPKKTLSAIDVMDIENWVEDLRENHKGRRGNAVISDGTIRHHLNALSSLWAPKTKVAKKVAKKPAKAKKVAEPKLPADAVERLRNGTSSIPIETKTLGLSYSVIQRRLKSELGAAGYTAPIKANRAAKSKVTKPKAAKKSRAKPAKAAGPHKAPGR